MQSPCTDTKQGVACVRSDDRFDSAELMLVWLGSSTIDSRIVGRSMDSILSIFPAQASTCQVPRLLLTPREVHKCSITPSRQLYWGRGYGREQAPDSTKCTGFGCWCRSCMTWGRRTTSLGCCQGRREGRLPMASSTQWPCQPPFHTKFHEGG